MTDQQKTMSGNRQYKMKVAGQLFKHLGLQMYSGAVPAIAELISNAYDAMARNVWITIPVGSAIQQNDVIIVKDDGCGMSFEECNSFYLSVGRDRRASQEGWSEEYNGLKPRKVQGRKGIGKLAGFGIANVIDIRTVKDWQIAHFLMDYDKLIKSPDFASLDGYDPEPLPDDGDSTVDKPGTIVQLSRLKLRRSIDQDQFIKSIARRLLVIDEDFAIHVNNTPISRLEIPFQFRFPEDVKDWDLAELENGQQFQWWAGFCKDTIPVEEQRGFVVYVRGKLAQTPWLFDLSGGVWGQHGMQYLTGEIKADFLDDAVDLVATDRGTVRWEDPVAVPLKNWGQKKIKELLEKWTENRRKEKIRSPMVLDYLNLAEKLPDRERAIFRKVVNRICDIPQIDKDEFGKDITDVLVEFAYTALTNRSFLEAIRRLNATSPEDMDKLNDVLNEWDMIELVNTAHVVKGRVAIIRKFMQMIEDRVREKPDMQDYVREHPWLIDPKWSTLAHETSLDNIIKDQFEIEKSGEDTGRRRLDFFCLGDKHMTAYVVETKRPGKSVGREEFDQIEDLVLFLREKLQDEADVENRRTTVRGLLIADKIKKKDRALAEARLGAGVFDMRTWDNLLISTKTLHEEFLNVVKERAPSDDPRMKSLSEDDITEIVEQT